MKNGLFDTHCHLTDKLYKNRSVTSIVNESVKAGVIRMIDVAVDFEYSKIAHKNSLLFNEVYFSVGIHPYSCKNGIFFKPEELKQINLWRKTEKLVAVGECGLDFYRENSNLEKKNQKDGFIKQIELSILLKLPLIIHSRNANNEVIKILTEYPKSFGVIHCFNGSLKDANEFINLGFLISFGGILTFEKTEELREIAKTISLNKIVLETDSPYLTPAPFRGKINFPYHIKKVANLISKLRNMPLEEIIRITSINATNLFKV